jgi:hypothetical protein
MKFNKLAGKLHEIILAKADHHINYLLMANWLMSKILYAFGSIGSVWLHFKDEFACFLPVQAMHVAMSGLVDYNHFFRLK